MRRPLAATKPISIPLRTKEIWGVKHEMETVLCRFTGCKESMQIARDARPAGGTLCCPTHKRILSWLLARPQREREQLDTIRRLIETGHFTMRRAGSCRSHRRNPCSH